MKTWAKVGIGCLAALLLICIISGIAFLVAGKTIKAKINEFKSGVVQTSESQAALKALEASHPFTPPADGVIPEDRLLGYIGACEQIHPAAESYSVWIESKKNAKGSFSDAKEAMARTGALLSSINEAFKTADMGPSEFVWINQALGEAKAEPSSTGTMTEGQRQVLSFLEARLRDPSTSPAEREGIRRQITELKAQSGTGGPASSPNARLYKRYKNRLEAANVDSIIFLVMGQTGRME